MAPVVGAGRLFGFAVFISAVLSIATPVAINHGLVYSILVRAVIGLAQVGLNTIENAVIIRLETKSRRIS